MLLKHGAIYNIENIENRTTIDFARYVRVINLKLIEELFEHAKTDEITNTDKLCELESGEFSAIIMHGINKEIQYRRLKIKFAESIFNYKMAKSIYF